MKAWSVIAGEDGCGYIVYAESRGRAITMALARPWFECVTYVEVKAHRRKKLDGKRDVECVLDWQKDARTYYEAGWWPEDGARSCEWCGLYEYYQFPESHIVETPEDGDVCAGCLAHEAEKAKSKCPEYKA